MSLYSSTYTRLLKHLSDLRAGGRIDRIQSNEEIEHSFARLERGEISTTEFENQYNNSL